LTPEETIALLSDWDLWSLKYQRLPPGKWRRWLLRCGRGAGKTHTGARTVNEVARDRSKIKTGEIGIIGRTLDEARFVMVEGSSGILANAPMDFVPLWEPGNKMLTWPNGVRGRIFSADKPEQMRGPNWAFIWGDEPAHWADPEDTWWKVIEPALRIGWARAMLTSTPIRDPFLEKLEARGDTVLTTASTYDNPYLSKSVIASFHEQYDGTTIGRQEMLGEYLPSSEHALWNQELIDNFRVRDIPRPFARVVVAVDPAVTAHEKSDETGIIVIGLGFDGDAYVLQDRSLKGSPHEWGKTAIAAYHRWQADVIVCETNNGGDLVESNMRGIDHRIHVKQVRASRGKVIRAEPAVALYERGKVHHLNVLTELEDQMVTWEPHRAFGTSKNKSKSPDRLDALVWGLYELYLGEDRPAGNIRAYL
jgi:phage terminase large subunit-like protein